MDSVLQVGKFYSPHRGGFETHLQTLASGLSNCMRVRVVAAGDEYSDMVDPNGVRVTKLRTSFQLAGAPVCFGLKNILRSAKESLIHLHHPNPYAMIAWLRANNPAPLMISYHSDIVRQRISGTLFHPILLSVLRKAAAIIVSSQRLLSSSRILSSFEKKCVVIPWGIDPKRYELPHTEKVNEIRNRYGARIVLAVGRFVYYKGFDYLIRAMKHVNGNLLLIGEGPLSGKLKRIAKASAPERIFFPGELDDDALVNYYHAADVFVLPSIASSEAFGLVQLEAMAAGKPVINTDLPSGVPEVSVDSETGITIPPGDESALAQAISQLLGNQELSKKYGSAGKDRVLRYYSATTMTERTIELYKNVLQAPGPQKQS